MAVAGTGVAAILMDGTAEFLIRMVVGAEGVAVTEQGGCAEQVDNGVLGQ